MGIEAAERVPLLPVRMLNEFTYCPRLFHLEWVQGDFTDNAFTIEGKTAHRRVDAEESQGLLAPDTAAPAIARSVELSSTTLGLSAKIDLVEMEGGLVCPVDYKRGKPPENPERSWEPERVQLCGYALLLREHGYRVEHGVLYFAAARTRVEVPFTDALVARTLDLLSQARRAAEAAEAPLPLVRDPKCAACSLNGICLPDELNVLSSRDDTSTAQKRHLVAGRDDSAPLYVQGQGMRVGIAHDMLQVRDRDRQPVAEARVRDMSQLVLMGNCQVSTQALHELCDRSLPICWLSYGGWFYGLTDGVGHKNVALRRAQFRAADDAERSLAIAKCFVRGKIANCRTMLRRNGKPDERTLPALADSIESVDSAVSLDGLLGIEGNAAREYFGCFDQMVRPTDAKGGAFNFDFRCRNRRPPKDPVNALLSLAYAMLAKDLTICARSVGFDPFLGLYHQPHYGRPALALDLMEEFRPLIADSAVLSAINLGWVRSSDFVRHALGVALMPDGRRRFLQAYERRMDEEITHPVFGYRISYRRVLEVQCRLLARHLLGEVSEYPEFKTR